MYLLGQFDVREEYRAWYQKPNGRTYFKEFFCHDAQGAQTIASRYAGNHDQLIKVEHVESHKEG